MYGYYLNHHPENSGNILFALCRGGTKSAESGMSGRIVLRVIGLGHWSERSGTKDWSIRSGICLKELWQII